MIIKFYRRDKEYCNKCRYCCTLSVCTTSQGSRFLFSNESLTHAKTGSLTSDAPNAAFGFSTDMRMYKTYDFRCLKPQQGVPSDFWPHYEMHGYRQAKTPTELDLVKEIPFDKYFYNFEDPEVLHAMTDGTQHGKDLWKKAYGFDEVQYIPGKGSDARMYKCYDHCLKEEYGKFAKYCKASGGIFKCCVYG